jgi:pSer/pThr/pTyr-binding forkhead associated (FHA) protein
MMERASVKRSPRALDQHFRALTPREEATVLQARAEASAFLLYDTVLDERKTLDFEPLDGPRDVFIGRADDHNDVTLAWAPSVSGTHAKIERAGTVWFLEDLDSKNGTFVNGERLVDRYRLSDGDVFSLSNEANAPRFEFNYAAQLEPTASSRDSEPPSLTPSQLRLLAGLCVHHLYTGGREPATDKEMAKVLQLSENSIKSGLTPIYRACGLADAGQANKRRRLVEYAIEHGLARREHLGERPGKVLQDLAELTRH